MKKKALAAAILAATTLSAAPAFAAQNPFKDIPKDHWAYDAVSMLAKDGVIGIFTGGFTAAAGGICAAVFFGYLFALIFRSGEKK